MDLYVGEKKVGSLPNEAVAAFYYCCQAWGFQADINKERTRLDILPPFTGHTLFMNSFSNPIEGEIQWNITKQLGSLGVEVKVFREEEFVPSPDYFLIVKTNEDESVSHSTMMIQYTASDSKEYWLEIMKIECMKAEIKLETQILVENVVSQKIHAQILYPKVMSASSREDLSNKITHILSMGLLGKLQQSLGVNTFSLFPITILFDILRSQNIQEVNRIEVKQPKSLLIRERGEGNQYQENPYRLEAFFDYYIIVNETRRYPNIMGKLYLKNTGKLSLKNPNICFRITPVGSVDISGQLLLPKVKNVLGVQTNQGSVGWQYLTDNWLEEADEKGEIWIKPIEDLIIDPNNAITVPNLQFKLNSSQVYKEVKVEAFIFFQDENYQVGANNKISLLFTPDVSN